jgi:hypothetical protein
VDLVDDLRRRRQDNIRFCRPLSSRMPGRGRWSGTAEVARWTSSAVMSMSHARTAPDRCGLYARGMCSGGAVSWKLASTARWCGMGCSCEAALGRRVSAVWEARGEVRPTSSSPSQCLRPRSPLHLGAPLALRHAAPAGLTENPADRVVPIVPLGLSNRAPSTFLARVSPEWRSSIGSTRTTLKRWAGVIAFDFDWASRTVHLSVGPRRGHSR